MKKFNAQEFTANVMKYFLYVALFFTILGFVLNLVNGSPFSSTDIAKTPKPQLILQNIASGDSSSAFYMSVYIICLSPFVSAIIIFICYLSQRRFKAAMLGLTLFIALIGSFFISN